MTSGMRAAFPTTLAPEVAAAVRGLGPAIHPLSAAFVQDSYRRRWGRIVLDGEELSIPQRHYDPPLSPVADRRAELVRQAWLTRSHDGHVREQGLRALLDAPAPWHVPFVVQLCGEYVIELGELIAGFARTLPERDATIISAYRDFWRTNHLFIDLTRARIASYWDAYYRGRTTLDAYPPHEALLWIERAIQDAA